MATGGGSFSHSVLKASDEIHDYSCSPCSENGHNSEAIYRCVECKTFLCAKCCDGHNQFVKGHKLVEARTKDIGGGLIHLKGYTCEEHQEKLIEMYCKTHDEVFCAVCILKHRSCNGVHYIPDIAKILLKNQDKKSVEAELKQQCVELQKLKHNRVKYLSILAENKDKNEQNIKVFKEELIKKAKEMEKSLLVEVEKKYKAIKDDVNLDVEKIDQLMNDVEKYLSKIVAEKYDDVKDEVITFKLSENQVVAANKQILDLALKRKERVDFQCTTTVEKLLRENRLGNLNISKKSRNIVHLYNADVKYAEYVKKKIKYLQSLLTDVGIHSKVTEELQDGNAGDLYVCVVSEIPDFEKLVKELNKGSFKNSRRYRVLVVCLVSKELKFRSFRNKIGTKNACPITDASSRKLCKENNLPYKCLNFVDTDFSDAVKEIRETVDE